jgi:hypothetical protein
MAMKIVVMLAMLEWFQVDQLRLDDEILVRNTRHRTLLPLSETTPGVVGSRVELLQLDGNVLARLASGRVKHMAGDGTPSHGELRVGWGVLKWWNGEKEREIAFESHILSKEPELPAFLDHFLSPTPRTHPHCVP